MKNGCPRCEKLPDDKICDLCLLAEAEHDLLVSIDCYISLTNKILANYDKALDIMLKKETEK